MENRALKVCFEGRVRFVEQKWVGMGGRVNGNCPNKGIGKLIFVENSHLI